VDDEPNILELLATSLRFAGFEVATATNGREALTEARRLRPDLVVLDVMMPGMDGPTLLKRMRAHPELANIPVIFMTAKVNAHESERLRELSAIGVIAKPFDPMTLGGQVKALWDSQ